MLQGAGHGHLRAALPSAARVLRLGPRSETEAVWPFMAQATFRRRWSWQWSLNMGDLG